MDAIRMREYPVQPGLKPIREVRSVLGKRRSDRRRDTGTDPARQLRRARVPFPRSVCQPLLYRRQRCAAPELRRRTDEALSRAGAARPAREMRACREFTARVSDDVLRKAYMPEEPEERRKAARREPRESARARPDPAWDCLSPLRQRHPVLGNLSAPWTSPCPAAGCFRHHYRDVRLPRIAAARPGMS
jgi:hypothetical protein